MAVLMSGFMVVMYLIPGSGAALVWQEWIMAGGWCILGVVFCIVCKRKYKEKFGILVEIISDEYQKIQEDIHKIVDRGTTLIEAEGGYTKDRRKVLMVIINNSQYTKLMEVVDKYDKDAFVIVSDVGDVHGKGFTKEVARL